MYYRRLGTSQKCPDYQGVLIFQVSLHDKVSFGTTARCVDYAGVHISSFLINRFHCIAIHSIFCVCYCIQNLLDSIGISIHVVKHKINTKSYKIYASISSFTHSSIIISNGGSHRSHSNNFSW